MFTIEEKEELKEAINILNNNHFINTCTLEFYNHKILCFFDKSTLIKRGQPPDVLITEGELKGKWLGHRADKAFIDIKGNKIEYSQTINDLKELIQKLIEGSSE